MAWRHIKGQDLDDSGKVLPGKEKYVWDLQTYLDRAGWKVEWRDKLPGWIRGKMTANELGDLKKQSIMKPKRRQEIEVHV